MLDQDLVFILLGYSFALIQSYLVAPSNPVLNTFFTCVCVRVCSHMHVGSYRGQKGIGSPDGVLETELWSSIRAKYTLNC